MKIGKNLRYYYLRLAYNMYPDASYEFLADILREWYKGFDEQ